MPLELYRPSRDDARLLSDLLYDGYSDDDVSALMYPVPASEESKASTAKATAESWGKNPREHVLVVRDTELGKSISWGHFFIETEKTGEEWKTFKEREFPPDWNSDFANAALREGWEKRVDIMGSQPYIYFQTLVTPPAYRRRGAGSKIVKAVVEYAAKANLPLYLSASPKGAPLYRSFGFQEKGFFTIDMSKISPEPRVNLCMLIPAPYPEQPPSVPANILPLTSLEDLTEFWRVHDTACGGSGLIELAFGLSDSAKVQPHEERARKDVEQLEASFKPENKDNHSYIYHKAEDQLTGQTLGCSKWYLLENPSIPHRPFGDGWPPGANTELLESSFGEINRFREKHMAGQKYALMCILVVVPEAQRKGIGTALLREGLKTVDKKGYRTWIDASPFGLGLYKRFGWKEVHSLTTDLKKHGGSGTETTVSLIREPGAKEDEVQKNAL